MARQLGAAASNPPDLGAQAVGVAERLESKQFHILVLGELERGKSTLVNALVGNSVLPTGGLPLTAVATEVRFGVEGSTVVHTDGSRHAIEREQLATYVTEAANPVTRVGVEHVPDSAADGFAMCRRALERFVVEDLDRARTATTLAQPARIAQLLEAVAALPTSMPTRCAPASVASP